MASASDRAFAPVQFKLDGNYEGMFSKVYSTGTQKAQVFVSPGGLSPTPNIYLHFHGHFADYKIDPDLTWDPKSGPKNPKDRAKPVKSGIDQAREAMTKAQDKNTIAILPQGLLGQGTQIEGDPSHTGGWMADIQSQGLPAFLEKIMTPLARDLGIAAGLTPGHIGIGGHSAGGYQGAHQALEQAGTLYDSITDLTFFDASYSDVHLEQARQWMLKPKAGKTLRLVNSYWQQTGENYRKRWQTRFNPDALEAYAKEVGMTVKRLKDGSKLDAQTKVMQHTQVIDDKGAVQCDVLVTMTALPDHSADHEATRDRFIDDAMLGVGGGAKANEDFGRYDKGTLEPGR